MNFTLLYHQILNSKKIKKDFLFLKKIFKIVVPEEKFYKKSICLTFDDGLFDFYYYVFPMLKELKIKAILAINPAYIKNRSFLSNQKRLFLIKNKNLHFFKEKFCTWEEIKKMADSNLVKIANHSYSHKNLLEDGIDLKKEIIHSKKIIEEKISKKIDIFVYPFGKFNKKIHNMVKKEYKYIMRIGTTFNLSWQNRNNLIYRINAKDFFRKKIIIFYYFFSYIKNSLRGR